MQLDVYCSQAHYWRHCEPIVEVLVERGVEVRTFASRYHAPWGELLRPRHGKRTTLVAGGIDGRALHGRPVIYVEHGAGQSYLDAANDGQGWSGGPGLDHCVLFVCPSVRVAERWRARYGDVRAVAVGCPALDAFHVERPRGGPVVFTSHWNCAVTPETLPAHDHYAAALPSILSTLRASGVLLAGHAHPRIARRMQPYWQQLGVEWLSDFDVVLSTARLVVADNTSALYEAAAVGIPVVALNAPWYRRDVEHGLRFWSHVPGLQCDDPADLARVILEAVDDPPAAQALRAHAVEFAYAGLDGRASERAADAIMECLDG